MSSKDNGGVHYHYHFYGSQGWPAPDPAQQMAPQPQPQPQPWAGPPAFSGYRGQPGQPAPGMANPHPHPQADSLVKGLAVGAGAAWLLTSEPAQRVIMRTAVQLWATLQGGIEELKERYHDAEAEAAAEAAATPEAPAEAPAEPQAAADPQADRSGPRPVNG
ncbi:MULTISPECIES: hypothetical protein [Paracoccus]|uniref:hypothetical protein n=1 Tax=Paracoccus TaxID=265 RepID=UPI001FB75043|nr:MULTISPECIES: hypothetical protein [Paracoccus]MCJ1900577.1 hypothetical protein [Paracoccus versutus]MDF3905586.1 hypothetical protein [Paracoccus sp. AS002]